MPTATTRNGFRKPDVGSDNNTWGSNLNAAVFDLTDASLDGWVEISTSGATTLTADPYIANQARMRIINYTANGVGTLTLPAVEKWYFVRALNYDCTLTVGATSATIKAGSSGIIFCDGSDCYKHQDDDFGGAELTNVAQPTSSTSVATKAYVDGVAFGSTDLPGITLSTNLQSVRSNGTSASWDFDGYQGRASYSTNHTVLYAERYMLLAATAALTFTLSASTTLKDKYIVFIANETTSSTVTIAKTGGDTINGLSSVWLAPGDVVQITNDGSGSFTAKYIVLNNAGPHVHIQDQKSNGTVGGSSLGTSYQTRTLNTVVRNIVGASLNSNEVTLPAGTWEITITAPASNTGASRAKLYNVTDAAQVFVGPSCYSGTGSTTTVDSRATGVVTITSSKTFRIEHYTESVSVSAGLGRPCSSGDIEIYSEFLATRIWP